MKSGNDTEYRASIFLLGGRAYPLRLEFSKAKQGVDDSKKNKPKPPPVEGVDRAAVEAAAPGRRGDPARATCRRTASPETFVVTTPFPPDDRSIG